MWLELTENPNAASFFDLPPSLQDVEIFTIKIGRDGPTVELAIALNEYPSSPPLRWRTYGANAVVMTLQVTDLEHIELQGWSTTNKVEIRITRQDEARLELVAEGGDFKMRAIFGFLRIAGFSPYHLPGPLDVR